MTIQQHAGNLVVAVTKHNQFDKCSRNFTRALFEVLHKAIEDDRRYWIRNDAKIKASYTAKTYDEFRETVDAAHLTPLTKTDKDKKFQTWNAMANGQRQE